MNRFQRCLAATVLSTVLMVPAVLRADCPNGSRATSETERQSYTAALNVIKDVPAAPAGWQLQLPKFGSGEAPGYVCKGLKLTAEYEVTYVSTDQQKVNQQRYNEGNARTAALEKLSPEEQSQVADFTDQGNKLNNQARTAQRNKDTAEAARLTNQAGEFYRKARAVRQAHRERVAAQVKAVSDEYYAAQIKPEVKVRLVAGDEPTGDPGSGIENVQIAGVPMAFFDRYGTLVLSFGRDAAGGNVRVEIKGVRDLALTVGRLFSGSNLRTASAK